MNDCPKMTCDFAPTTLSLPQLDSDKGRIAQWRRVPVHALARGYPCLHLTRTCRDRRDRVGTGLGTVGKIGGTVGTARWGGLKFKTH